MKIETTKIKDKIKEIRNQAARLNAPLEFKDKTTLDIYKIGMLHGLDAVETYLFDYTERKSR